MFIFLFLTVSKIGIINSFSLSLWPWKIILALYFSSFEPGCFIDNTNLPPGMFAFAGHLWEFYTLLYCSSSWQFHVSDYSLMSRAVAVQIVDFAFLYVFDYFSLHGFFPGHEYKSLCIILCSLVRLGLVASWGDVILFPKIVIFKYQLLQSLCSKWLWFTSYHSTMSTPTLISGFPTVSCLWQSASS